MSSPLSRKLANLAGSSVRPCDRFQEWLEDSRRPESGLETYENLLAAAPPEERAHVQACSDCRDAASDLVDLRNLLRDLESAPVAGPWFAPRVMANIAALQEEQVSRVSAIWLAVPRFAKRLSWVAAAALVFSCAWLYERPAAPPQTASAFASEHLFDPPALPVHSDDVLVSMNEKDK